jgi:hypothetical protein
LSQVVVGHLVVRTFVVGTLVVGTLVVRTLVVGNLVVGILVVGLKIDIVFKFNFQQVINYTNSGKKLTCVKTLKAKFLFNFIGNQIIFL